MDRCTVTILTSNIHIGDTFMFLFSIITGSVDENTNLLTYFNIHLRDTFVFTTSRKATFYSTNKFDTLESFFCYFCGTLGVC